MRFFHLAMLVVIVASASAQQAKFIAKFQKVVSTYLGTNTPKACDMIMSEVIAGSTIEAIAKKVSDSVLTLVPSTKYMDALTMLGSFDSCLKGCGTNMTVAMGKLGAVFAKFLGGPYKKCNDKAKAMRALGKANAEISTQVYIIATAACTPTLVQQIINGAMAKSTPCEYNCSQGPLKKIMVYQLYNWTYKSG